MTERFDIAVIGAGIAGASVAARLASAGKNVVLIEMERQPGYHTTGRSAAIFAPSYGPEPIRALTRASEAFFRSPPAGFTATPLFSPRATLMIARADQSAALAAMVAEMPPGSVDVVDAKQVRQLFPLVRDGYAQAGMLDRAGQDIDVDALHQGFLRQFRDAGGTVRTHAPVTALVPDSPWRITCGTAELSAGQIVNAAGAWADQLGQLAGAEPIGLIPKRRTAAMIAAPDGYNLADAPLTVDVEETFYIKPEAGRLLISPADETPSLPCDAQPEELDLAIGVDRVQTACTLDVRRIESKWAGLRSFVADKSPVAGFSGRVPGFYWLAGQGGYGIQTAPALSELAAAEILGQKLPAHISDQGVHPGDLSPARLEGATCFEAP